MNLEKGRISSFQLTVLATIFFMGSSGLIAPGLGAKNSAWLAIIAGLIEALVFIWIFTSLANRYPGKTLVEINDTTYGPYLGKMITALYLFYFLTMSAWVLRNFADFLNIIMPVTPRAVFILAVTLLCAFAVRSGLEVISRCGFILLFLLVTEIIISIVFLAPDMDFSNLLPVMDIPVSEFIKAVNQTASYPFGESIVFLMIIAFLNQQKKGRRSIIQASLTACMLLVIVAIRNTAILGPMAEYKLFTSFSAIRLIDLANIITRIEVIVLFNFLTIGFMYISIVYYSVVLGTAQMLKMRSYLPLVLPVGVIYFIYSQSMFDNIIQSINYANTTYPYFTLLFQLLLPLLTLIITIIKKPPQKPEGGKI